MFGSKDRSDDGSTRLTPGADRAHGTSTDADVTSRMTGTTPRHAATDRDAHAVLEERGVRPAKTSAAAAFALVFGLSALFCALTGILAPAAVVLGLIGVLLGLVGRRKGRLPGITGRSVATGGLVTAVLGLLLGLAVVAGLAVYVNQQGLDGLQDRIDQVRDDLPTGSDVVEQVPGS